MSTTNSSPPSSPPHRLLAAARAGDDDAFAAIVRQHGPPVMTTCLRWVKDHHTAEDLTQDVFVRLLRSDIAPLDDRELRRWLLQVARNVAIDHHRHSEVVRRSEDAAVDLVIPESAPQRTVEMRVLIAQVLHELSDRDAELVVEHYMEDLSLREMAERRGTTRNTIKVQLHRARARARAIARDRRIDGLPWLPAPFARVGSTLKGLATQVGVKGAAAVLAPLLVIGGAVVWVGDPAPNREGRTGDVPAMDLGALQLVDDSAETVDATATASADEQRQRVVEDVDSALVDTAPAGPDQPRNVPDRGIPVPVGDVEAPIPGRDRPVVIRDQTDPQPDTEYIVVGGVTEELGIAPGGYHQGDDADEESAARVRRVCEIVDPVPDALVDCRVAD